MNVRKVFFIAKLLLIAMLAIVVIRTALVLWRAACVPTLISAAGTEGTTAIKSTTQVDNSTKDYTSIIEQNVFSHARSSSAMQKSLSDGGATTMVPSAEEELGLVLIGAIAGPNWAARAIIQNTRSNVADRYKIGEMVAGARVESIQKEAVVLLYNGQSKILRLQIGRNDSQSQTDVSRSQTGTEVAIAARSGARVTKVPSQQTGYVETILGNAVIEPYSVNGKTEGLKVSGLENLPMAKEVGLKNGDIVREVNGHQLTDKRKAYQVLKKARTQPSVSVELQREGETKELSFALR